MEMSIDDSRESAPMSREEVVETLKTMVFVQAFKRFNVKEREALDYAISSLKTDEAYQLIYEGEEIYTKDEVIAMLTDIQSEFKEGLRCKGCCNNCVNACEDIPAGWFLDFIDAKINLLKESTDGME